MPSARFHVRIARCGYCRLATISQIKAQDLQTSSISLRMDNVCCVRALLEPSTRIGDDEALITRAVRSGCRVLVVDDDETVAGLVSEIVQVVLQEEAVVVHSAEEAINKLQHGEFDLVISDIRMPGIGGFGLLKWIELHRPELTRQFLFVSGDPGGTAAESALARAEVPFLEKPFSCSDLARWCRELLANADSQRRTGAWP